MDLYIDKDALESASDRLGKKCEELGKLKQNLETSFETLKSEWDSDAGKQFYDKFKSDLLDNLDDYVRVFEHMSTNLSTASTKYDEVFRDANTLVQLEY